MRSTSSSGRYETVDDVPSEIAGAAGLASLELFLAEAAYSRHADHAGRYFSAFRYMDIPVTARAQPGSGHIQAMGFDWKNGDTGFVVKDAPDEISGVTQISKRGNEGILELRPDDIYPDNCFISYINVALLDNTGAPQVELTVL